MKRFASCSWSGRFGETLLTVYGPDDIVDAVLAGGGAAAAPVELASEAEPQVDVGQDAPAFGGGRVEQVLSARLIDPRRLVSAVRNAASRETDVYCDLAAPDGRGGTPETGTGYRWRFSVTDAGPLSRRPSLTRGASAIELRGRCGLARLSETDGSPTSIAATVAGYLRALANCALPESPLVVSLPVWPEQAGGAGTWRDPRLVRFAATEAGRLVKEDATCEEATRAVLEAWTAQLVVDPRASHWRLRPGGDPEGDWGLHRVPVVRLMGRSHTGGVASPEVETARSVVYPAAWVGTTEYPNDVERDASPAAAPIELTVANTYDDDPAADGVLPPLRTLVVSTPAGVDLAAAISETLGDGETAERRLGSFAVSDDVTIELTAASSFQYSSAESGNGRAGVRCDTFDGRVLYGTASGWGTLVSYALSSLGDTDQVETIPLTAVSGFSEGVISLIADGLTKEDPSNSQVEEDANVFARAVLVDADGNAVTKSSVRVSEGFRGREATMAGLPEMELYTGASWGTPPGWRSDAAARSFDFARDAQAAERFAQERDAPLPVRVETRGLVGPTDAVTVDLGTPGVAPYVVACTVVGGGLALAAGTSSLQTATVELPPLTSGGTGTDTDIPEPQS